jgi:hypothetical protein
MIPTNNQSGYAKETTIDGMVMPSLPAVGFKQIRRHCLLVVGPFRNDFLRHFTYSFVRKNWFGNVNPVWCECGSLSRPSQQREALSKKSFYQLLKSPNQLKLFFLWSRIVNAYAVKPLTQGSDILLELSDLAKQFRKGNAGTYLAGLWEVDLPLCLLWEAHAAKASPYRAPIVVLGFDGYFYSGWFFNHRIDV